MTEYNLAYDQRQNVGKELEIESIAPNEFMCRMTCTTTWSGFPTRRRGKLIEREKKKARTNQRRRAANVPTTIRTAYAQQPPQINPSLYRYRCLLGPPRTTAPACELQ